ncbi:ABC transporter substrate-binding protein [Tomitella fengzijianii]|uniref:ABC transporter substrate-binding protein n=1 Tax=Tomitella fengzijianii TaxID=2597660 RepID=A0A516X5W7_9ACTN|nr:ABC transporter substrate-binding protein [Tomitella fengzijianii]QDQ98436.1 ABC transporter substrate-binding protein [Tomitella fengzijianii]
MRKSVGRSPRLGRRGLLGAVAVLSAVALTLGGCSRGGDADTADAAAGTQQSGDDQRIAALGLGDTDTLLALGITPVAIAPWGAQGDVAESGVGPWAQDALGDARPPLIFNTASGFTADIVENVAAANPTQIIAVNNAVNEQAKADLERIAPVTVHPPEYKDWQVPWKEQVTTIADAVGKPDQGQELIEQAEASLAGFRESHPELQGKKAAVVMPYAGKLGLYTEGDGRGAMIEKLGFTIPDQLQATSDGTFYKDIAPENYRDLDVLDYLFVLDYEGAADAVRDSPIFQGLDLVKQDKVYYLDQATGNAMSMPNPLTIPYAVDAIDQQL